MSDVTVYTTPICPYCHAAKALLQQKSVSFTEIDVSADPSVRDAMTARANGQRTVPQIFINNMHIGGCDDLYALDRQDKLDALLQL